MLHVACDTLPLYARVEVVSVGIVFCSVHQLPHGSRLRALHTERLRARQRTQRIFGVCCCFVVIVIVIVFILWRAEQPDSAPA